MTVISELTTYTVPKKKRLTHKLRSNPCIVMSLESLLHIPLYMQNKNIDNIKMICFPCLQKIVSISFAVSKLLGMCLQN